MTEESRRRWRSRLLLAGVLPLLLALALGGKVGLMWLHADDGRASYDRGDFAAARDAFASNASLNLFETWVAPYDEGTARVRLGDLTGAVRLLEEALETVPRAAECRVRLNLALAHEAIGDSLLAADASDGAGDGAGDAEDVRSQWRAGVDVLAAGGCTSPDRDRPADVTISSTEVDSRLRAKLGQVASDPAALLPPHERVRDEQLEQRNARAERLRDRAEQRHEDQPVEPSAAEPSAPPTYHW